MKFSLCLILSWMLMCGQVFAEDISNDDKPPIQNVLQLTDDEATKVIGAVITLNMLCAQNNDPAHCEQAEAVHKLSQQALMGLNTEDSENNARHLQLLFVQSLIDGMLSVKKAAAAGIQSLPEDTQNH
ncbi:hypothetical protein [Alteromonas macleodii]|uniref:Secreted protein n=1 Tax=Alteromonas macleodii TaxID=28108 RepID=A0AB36FL09_ALTMA|nr:hypothetical protein [Alteromonas macleodii]OES24147.1 hypothetical protein BFV93_4747 [Alteromonas macleodii]OES24781.1 hypothetical protein BFV95_4540 [Alteromonas macleodii]OES25059.1 hypothetical protein BFV94_4530 [Alteromonas macleodii]OES39103.1 hypothetical protein BFV96_4251 [Alteromonas macleodii]